MAKRETKQLPFCPVSKKVDVSFFTKKLKNKKPDFCESMEKLFIDQIDEKTIIDDKENRKTRWQWVR